MSSLPVNVSSAERRAALLLEAAAGCFTPGALATFGLSPREAEILDGLRRGLTARQLGDELFISARTVHHHLERIYRKLGVHSAAAAVAVAMSAQLAG
jgi:DNA-binding CsgD family transcriptional regulator